MKPSSGETAGRLGMRSNWGPAGARGTMGIWGTTEALALSVMQSECLPAFSTLEGSPGLYSPGCGPEDLHIKLMRPAGNGESVKLPANALVWVG